MCASQFIFTDSNCDKLRRLQVFVSFHLAHVLQQNAMEMYRGVQCDLPYTVAIHTIPEVNECLEISLNLNAAAVSLVE